MKTTEEIKEMHEANIKNNSLPIIKVDEDLDKQVDVYFKRRNDENDRLSSDTDTTVDNSVDTDNIVSKMTIPIIEVDEEIDREIDKYLSKQDGYREVRMVTCKSCGLSSESGLHTCRGLQFGTEENEDEHHESELDLDTFTAHGFEVPDFDGEILKEVDGYYIGYVMRQPDIRVVSMRWDNTGQDCNNYGYNLTPINQDIEVEKVVAYEFSGQGVVESREVTTVTQKYWDKLLRANR